MFKTLTNYNDCKNMTLYNTKIKEAVRKITEEISIAYSNNVAVDTFSHAFNTQRENPNIIFIIENQDELDKMVEAINNLTINDAK